jgi:arylsulfatase A-like enzyme
MTRNAICLVVDGWNTSAVGAYGNTWLETPAIDRLATQSIVLDQHLIDAVDLAGLYQAWWEGQSAVARLRPNFGDASLPRRLRDAGQFAVLVTDDERIAANPRAEEFAEKILGAGETPRTPADDVAETQLVRLFAAATEWLAGAREPFLLWIHARGMYGAWDAPLDFRRRLVEEDDPQPPDFAVPPELTLSENYDPDERLGYRYAYGGQAMLVDLCVEALLDALAETGLADRTLVSLCGGRGFPLGEHRRVGFCDAALYEELIHVPWLLRVPGSRHGLSRSSHLVQPADLFATLVEWCELAGPLPPLWSARSVLGIFEDSWQPRDRVCVASPDGFAGQRGIRTPAWYLREAVGAAPELYAKPDDRFEVNDVAMRCQGEAELLAQALKDTLAAARDAALGSLPPLDESLVASHHS